MESAADSIGVGATHYHVDHEVLWDEDEPDWVFTESFNNLEDNTHSWGPLYFWRGPAASKRWPLFVALTREVSPPWRRGMGLGLRYSVKHAMAVGMWKRGSDPHQVPSEQSVTRTVRRSRRLDAKNRRNRVDSSQ